VFLLCTPARSSSCQPAEQRDKLARPALLAQSVERFHGKEEVIGSNPMEGSEEGPAHAGLSALWGAARDCPEARLWKQGALCEHEVVGSIPSGSAVRAVPANRTPSQE
jgi:hypothetical protein